MTLLMTNFCTKYTSCNISYVLYGEDEQSMCSNSKLWTFWSHSHPNDVQIIFCDRNASVKHFFAMQSQFRDPEVVVLNHKNLSKVILRDRIEIYWSWFIDFEPNFMVINSQLYKIINIDNGLYKLSIVWSNKLHTLVCGYVVRTWIWKWDRVRVHGLSVSALHCLLQYFMVWLNYMTHIICPIWSIWDRFLICLMYII